jgi:multicomponent Na+:H+ antiporter subunit D
MRCLNVDADWIYRKGGNLIYRFLDRSLNGLNRWSDRVFVQGFAASVSRGAQDLTARACLLIMVSAWILMGFRGPKLDFKKRRLYESLMTGTIPVGITAGVATVFLFIVFFLV